MGLLLFLSLGWILKLTQCMDLTDLELDRNVTGVLGEDVYLRCQYNGQNAIMYSSWGRLDAAKRMKKLAGFNPQRSFGKGGFATPASVTNLTVSLAITSLEAEGEYTCVFDSEDEEIKGSVFLSVLARPDIHNHVTEKVINGTHYQFISCSASHGKPTPQVSWEIHGARPRADVFSIDTTSRAHLNGTASVTSVLRFPIHLNEEDKVSCVVQHSALAEPRRVDTEVHTFVSPNVTIETVLVQEEGEDLQEVVCRAVGGRPPPNITWILPGDEDTLRMQKYDVGVDAVVSSYRLPLDLYEGENVTCIFGYPKLHDMKTRTMTLPTFYLSSLQLVNHTLPRSMTQSSNSLLLEEGDVNITIKLNVVGNVPHYKIICTKEGYSLPEYVQVVGTNLWMQGPVTLNHTGLYNCEASYRHHTVSLQLDIQVNPQVQPQATSPPNIRVSLTQGEGIVTVECLAADAAPAANVSWVLPPDLNGKTTSEVTFRNGTITVRDVLVLPSCLPFEQNVECVIDHLLLEEPERRQVILPACAPPDVSMSSTTVWEDSVAYAEVKCRVDSVEPAARVALSVEDCRGSAGTTEPRKALTQTLAQGNSTRTLSTLSTLLIPIYLFSGCKVMCVVEHSGLTRPETNTISIPSVEASVSHVSVGEQADPPHLLAGCQYSGGGLIANLSWLLPDGTIRQPALRIRKDGVKVNINSTYTFELDRLEGKSLTCLIQKAYNEVQHETIHIPKYFISSVVVRNKTTLLHGNQHTDTAVYRVALQENLASQRILLKVNGNTPSYKIECDRNDGSVAQTVAGALVFSAGVSEGDAGLYMCQASYYHHKATVLIQVDVISEEAQHMIFAVICLCTAAAITLFLVVTMCVLCHKSSGNPPASRKDRKKRESLAALMQDPRSPELSRRGLHGAGGPEYAELVHYSIVVDVKSTV